jgi:hypothetical protein
MSRRSLFGAIGIVALLFLSIGTGLLLLLRYEPAQHRAAVIPVGEERSIQSRELTRNVTDLWSAMASQPEWGGTFTDAQVNSYLTEGLMQTRLAEKVLPEAISEPRVTFEPDRMRLSFRYSNGLLNTVVSVVLRVWLPRNEPNVLAVRIDSIQAGMLPFKAQWLLERISEVARQNEVDVSWYRHEGQPVAVVRFEANKARPSLQLLAVRFEKGSVAIRGRSGDVRTAMAR